ncbi:MAG: tyrosine-type recombinase/integrase, partial [Desulfobacterales bacterium]
FNEKTQNRYLKRPKMMYSICKRAGIKPLSTTKRKIGRGKNKGKFIEMGVYFGFHSLRHFMASYLLDEEKVSLKTVSELLRHRNVRTTEIYLHAISQSKLNALDNIEGKFTPKLAYPPPTAATTNNKGLTVNG